MTIHPVGIGIAGPSLNDEERRVLRETPPIAVVLFARNVRSPEQLYDLVREIRGESETPPVIMIDEEGGRVDRLRDLVAGIPGASRASLFSDPEDFAYQLGRSIGRLLRHFDIDVNLAPVVDIERDVAARGLEERSWGTSITSVVKRAGRFVSGHRSQGVANCLKHFPGMGGGSDDPHKGPSVIQLPRDEIVHFDLAPFRALGDVVHAIMIGHCVYSEIDPDTPATLSSEISTTLLRRDLHFQGLALSDDMEMHAVSEVGTYPEVSIRAIKAGSDVLLICSKLDAAIEVIDAIRTEARHDEGLSRRLEEAVERMARYRAHIGAIRGRAEEREASLMAVQESFDRLNSTA